MTPVRGRGHLKLLDRYLGIPAIALLGVRRKRSLPSNVAHIGLMKTAAIGDTALLAGLVDDVKRTFPNAHLTVISGLDNAGVVPLLGSAVDDTITVSPGQLEASVRSLRNLRLDAMVDFGSWPRFDALLAALSGAGYTVGFETRDQFRHYAYDVTVPHSKAAHERQNYVALLRAIGVNAQCPPRLSPPRSLASERIPRADFAVFHPWSSGYHHEVKEWRLERWVSLACEIAPRIPEVVVTGGAAEVGRSQELVDRLRRAGVTVTNMSGQLSIGELTDLLSASEVVVSVNTGVAHLAGLVGAPTVSLEGPTPPARWAPLGPRVRTVVTTLAGSGYLNLGFEYGGQRRDCMDGISVGAVAEAITQALSDDVDRPQFAPMARAASSGSDQGD